MRVEVIASLAIALVTSPLRAGVLTVSPAGPSDFHQIQDAVTAAADGDIILVKDGVYDPFVVTHKTLDIEADGADVVAGGVVVLDLAADETFVMRGIDGFTDPGPDVHAGLHIQNCVGPVRVEDGRFRGTHESPLSPAFPGASIVSSASVALHGCRMVGGKNSMTSVNEAGDGLDISGASHVSLWNCNCGGELNYSLNGLPAAGVVLEGGTLFASGTDFAGGSQSVFSPACKSGADALDLGGGAQAQLLNDTFEPGAGSSPTALCPGGGAPGLTIHADAASGSGDTVLPGLARTFTATSPVREGQSLTLTFHGAPFESAILLQSLTAQDLFVAGLHGTFLLGSPFATLPLGTTDALGDLSFSATVPELGAGVSGVTLHCQGFFFSPGSKYVGPPSPTLLLDSAY